MNTAVIRQKLHQFIDAIEDKKVEAIYTLLEEDIDIDTKRKKLIQAEREKYLLREGQTYSWDEAKKVVLGKDQKRVI